MDGGEGAVKEVVVVTRHQIIADCRNVETVHGVAEVGEVAISVEREGRTLSMNAQRALAF